ncbi:MAG: hypothetical protein UV74_C0013G0005 [Candidatus Woesebacteria bacterium GW2011_GWB1_43_14]|uniref:Uncharacterized protein n=1 Tax=Candidatus Woesebacteria bacterium GW2011_GWB1_43_14 TaxID=1618578 RepID=A0A0G1GDC0_9BACT|nr:MAG: hypothetical protein UV51_C0009G0005 [Candidatus Woesebacteria bacterium GW2011_GWC1_42_9]KKS96883.1 MAG: hypothetical protein UV74_C0013G0005 [Candidatus Woesebacteria bacterium GW2011_GWB1_43_14]
MRKVLYLFSALLAAGAIAAPSVGASEGTFELQNTSGENARCFAASVLMSDQNYNVLLSCRDITYPGTTSGTDIFSYIVWGSGTDGKTYKLGELGVGKVYLKTKNAFDSLFITREKDADTRSPKGETVMKGSIQNIDFLDTGIGELNEDITPTPTPKASNINLAQLSGALAFIGIFALAIILFLITRR